MNKKLFIFLLFIVSGLSVSCTDQEERQDKRIGLLAIEIQLPKSIALGTSHQTTATGIYEDGSKGDLTKYVSWESSDPSVITIGDTNSETESSDTLRTSTKNLRIVESSSDIEREGEDSDNGNAEEESLSDNKGLIATLKKGQATITASLGDKTGSTDLTVSDAKVVSISISPPQPSIALGTNLAFVATGIYTDDTIQDITGLVNWSVSDSSVAEISNDTQKPGILTSLSPGVVDITATIDDEISYTIELIVRDVELVSIAVSPTNPSIAMGTDIQLNAIGVYSDNTTQDLTKWVTWSSSNKSVATLNTDTGNEGLISGVETGNTQVSAAIENIVGTTQVTVTNAQLVSISISPTNPSIVLGTPLNLKAIGIYSDNTNQEITNLVIWSSANTNVAEISNLPNQEGNVTSAGKGKTSITATMSGIEGTTNLTVTDAVLTSIAVTPTNPSIVLGTTLQLQATGIYSDNSTQSLNNLVIWSSSDSEVAVVSNTNGSEGVVTSVGKGVGIITAKLGDTSGSTSLTITDEELISLSITPTNPFIALGIEVQLTATGTYTDQSTQNVTASVTWSSSNTLVATISNVSGHEGTAFGVSAGDVIITATLDNISSSTNLTGSSSVKQGIFIDSAVAGVNYVSGALTGTTTSAGVFNYENGKTVKFTVGGAVIGNGIGQPIMTPVNLVPNGSSSHQAVINIARFLQTLDEDGDPTNGINITPAVVAAIPETEPIDFNVSTEVFGRNPVVQAIVTAVFQVTAETGGRQTLVSVAQAQSHLEQSLADINAPSPPTGPTVTTVELVSLSITPTNPSIALGTEVQLTATGIYSDQSNQDLTSVVTWISSNSFIAAISNASGSEGAVTSVGTGTALMTAALGNINTSTSTTITDAELISISITPTNPSIALGTGIQVTATGTYTDQSTQDLTSSVTWSSSDPSIATISNASGSRGSVTPVPKAMVGLVGVIDKDTNSALVTVTLVELLILLKVAVSAEEPVSTLVTEPLLPLALLMVAMEGSEELQVTDEVKSWVL